ncbi:hypothetical protein [Defluviitalea phaphyphila]|uniref:hypothetical protein n=1 Tax=Defluviitalea phaphyphila TaxID=1473580 RepID=UPI000730D74D|nr:hypothetical protein [Defluviitalea phaphyphila]
MKKYAFTVLGIIFFSGLVFPFIEMLGIFIDKSQIENAFRQASKSAIFKSYEFADRANQTNQINFKRFVEEYIEIFQDILDVQLVNTYDINSMSEAQIESTEFIFRSIDERYNDISVKFKLNSGISSECNVTIKSKYRFKTNYMKIAESINPNLAFFEIGINKDILLIAPN